MKIKLPHFEDKKDAIKYIIANKEEIIAMKKSVPKRSDIFSSSNVERHAIKAAASTNDDTDTVINRTIIGSTYYWFDTYGDVHLENVFAKSIKERKGKIPHLHDHLFEITAKVGIPKNIYEKYIDWKDLGINKAGQTQSLFMDSSIEKELNPQIFKGYLNDEINQHSVYMVYDQVALAVDDTDYKDEYKVWKDIYPLIGNQAEVKDAGFFWAVKVARLIELSCVLEGSNELTPTLESSTKQQPVLSTVEEPQMVNVLDAIKNYKFSF